MDKRTLIQQFDTCYDTNDWFVAVRIALEGVNAEQAAWKPDGADHSIWELVNHLSFYNLAYLERFKSIDYAYPTEINDETFSGDGDEAEWTAAVGRFDAIMTEWRGLITAAHEAKFDQPLSDSNHVSWAELIANVNTHNAYHGGQILLLRKLQGSWNPAKGVS